MPSIDEEIKNLQLDRPGRGKSADQLKKHTITEQFENKPIERALHLLTKGDEIQKISILQQLPQLVLIDENATYSRILPKIQQELPNSSCEFHIHASRMFQIFLLKPKAPPNLLAAVLQGIESRDLIVVNSWLETLLTVIPSLSEEAIRKEIMPIIVTKSAMTQPVMSRISAGLIIGKIAIHPKFKPPDIKQSILPVAQTLCQDVQPEVRASVCQQLPNIAQGIGEDMVKQHLLPCLVELASENNAIVKSAAISATITMMKNMNLDTKKGTIVPLFKKLLNVTGQMENVTASALAKDFGELIKYLQPCLNNVDIITFLQFFKTLAKRGLATRTGDARFGDPSVDVMCRDRCATQLPAVLSVTVQFVPDQTELMYAVFRELGTDPCYIVRRSVGKCMSEVASILGAQNKIMKPDIVRLLRDDAEEVLETLVPNIGSTMQLLSKQGVLSREKADQSTMEIGRALLKCQLELTKGYNWRLLVEYLSQLEKFCLYVPCEFIHQHFTPVVMTNAFAGRALPVRSQAIHTLLVFLLNNNKENQQKWVRENLLTELCYSNSSYTRRLYVILCSHALDIFPPKYFKDYFFNPLLNMAVDPISNIRLMFVNLLPKLNKMIGTLNDPRAKQQLSEALTRLENGEKNTDVIVALKGKPKVPPVPKPTSSIMQANVNFNPNPNFRPSVRPSVQSVQVPPRDMTFLNQHFYTDAGISLPVIEKESVANPTDKKELFIEKKFSENSLDTNITDDTKVNLRKIAQKNTEVTKRHSSVFSVDCLEAQQRKVTNRRSLNIPNRELSKIPVFSKTYLKYKSQNNLNETSNNDSISTNSNLENNELKTDKNGASISNSKENALPDNLKKKMSSLPLYKGRQMPSVQQMPQQKSAPAVQMQPPRR